MPFDTLALVGVGFLGGSVGLAARRRGVARYVVGIDRCAMSLERSLAANILDRACPDLPTAAKSADVVVFCTPVDSIASQVIAAAPHCRPGTLLTDVGSTKARIVNGVAGKLPAGVAFVGAHPLAGSEKQGPDHADADLFDGKVVVLTPGQATQRDIDRATEFWSALGATVRILDADEHDRALALTSHLPHLTASALAATVPTELHELTATGFQDMTRLAAGPPDVWTAIFNDNRDALLPALDAYRARLDLFRTALLAGDREMIQRLLLEGKQNRDAAQS